MTVDLEVLPGLALLALEFFALSGLGLVVSRTLLRQADIWMAMAQGLVIGPALWGLTVNFVMYLIPGRGGAAVAWAVVLAIGLGLAWRRRLRLRCSLPGIVGFTAIALVLFWVSLGARQLLTIPDPEIHLEVAAAIRAGSWPPTLPWNPWLPLYYHYGTDLLIGLLAPPSGPDLALVTEIFGAYAWTALALIVATMLRRGGWVSVLVLTPLLLSSGAWTLIGYVTAPDVLRIPVPTGLPAAGLRAALAEIYWPAVEAAELPWTRPVEASPPNIWKPQFLLTYALFLVVLTSAGSRRLGSWWAVLTLSALVGFVGLMEETVALMALTLWAVLEVMSVRKFLFGRSPDWHLVSRSAAGPAIATLLLVAGGGVVTGILTGSLGSVGDFEVSWTPDAESRRPLATLDALQGGIGVLGIGPLVVAIFAGLLARRDQLVMALSAASIAFLLASLMLQYEPARDVTRLDGHARTFALLSLLIAISGRLVLLRPLWRHVLGAGLLSIVTLPTVAAPTHSMLLGMAHGPKLENAQPGQPFVSNLMRRYVVGRPIPNQMVTYIDRNMDANARILSPEPSRITIATGRSNASGFPGHLHLHPKGGAEYLDSTRYLEPSAIRRLGFTHVHAPSDWIADLPERAQEWLADPQLFDPLLLLGTSSLLRIQPAFLELEVQPSPGSFEALRRTVPASAKVYLAPAIDPIDSVRVASVLAHARLLGQLHHANLYLLTEMPTEPLGSSTPDFVVVSSLVAPSALIPDARQPVWRNDKLAVYTPRGDYIPITSPAAPLFSLQLSDVQIMDGSVAFTALFTDRVPSRWSGQDWLVAAADTSP